MSFKMRDSLDGIQTALNVWHDAGAQDLRYQMLLDLAESAGIQTFFETVPPIHFKIMSYDQFMIVVQGMAKIREMRRIADK